MTGAFRDECALFAVGGHARAVAVMIAGLRASKRRAKGVAGLAASDGLTIRSVRGEGDPEDALAAAMLRGVSGPLAIGSIGEAEGPFVGRVKGNRLAIAFAGRLTNGARLAREQDERGAVTVTGTDAELLAQLVAQSAQRTPVNRFVDALWKVEGAFAAVALTDERLVAVRDPRGIRPLFLGRLEGAVLFATEESAIPAAGGEIVREVEPGEMVIVDGSGMRSVAPFPRRPRAVCAQEATSLARADAHLAGHAVHEIRTLLGERLAMDAPCAADVVVPLDEPSIAAGYAKASELVWQPGFVAEGRTPVGIAAVLASARVVITAASVAPERLRDAVTAARRAGAREVHVRVATPDVRHGCAYGFGGPTGDELADERRLDWTRRLGADSIALQTHDAWRAALTTFGGGFCDGCTSGQWPVVPEVDGQLALFGAEPPKP